MDVLFRWFVGQFTEQLQTFQTFKWSEIADMALIPFHVFVECINSTLLVAHVARIFPLQLSPLDGHVEIAFYHLH